jgi:hypothetical protein
LEGNALKIDPEVFEQGIFIWEDTDDNLNIGMSEELQGDPLYALFLLTEAARSITMQMLQSQTAH